MVDPAGHQVFSKDINITKDGKVNLTYVLEDGAMKGSYTITASQGSDEVPLTIGVGEDPNPQITMTTDKLSYQNTDKPVISATGPPSSVLNLVIIDPSEKQKFADTIKLGPDGIATYSFNLTSYTSGVYSAVITHANDKVEKSFAVGLSTGSGKIDLKTVKDEYLQGESIIVIGTANANTILQISLIDPASETVKSVQTFTDKNGHFSSFDFKIPPSGALGIWQLDAASGINHKTLSITVGSLSQGITVHLDKIPGVYSRGDAVTISGTNAGITAQVNVDISGGNNTQTINLKFSSTNTGDYSTVWKVPIDFYQGTYTIQASSLTGKATVSMIVR
jgi:hypothetical protein